MRRNSSGTSWDVVSDLFDHPGHVDAYVRDRQAVEEPPTSWTTLIGRPRRFTDRLLTLADELGKAEGELARSVIRQQMRELEGRMAALANRKSELAQRRAR